MLVNKRMVYIVDDDESVRRALGMLLATYGFTSVSFASAEDFFSTVPNSAPGCLILDIHMPGLDGWETQQVLLDSGSKRPVIMISGDEDCGLMNRAFKANTIGYLRKPFRDGEMVDLIRLTVQA
jgi:two-component system response regulator FixJ